MGSAAYNRPPRIDHGTLKSALSTVIRPQLPLWSETQGKHVVALGDAWQNARADEEETAALEDLIVALDDFFQMRTKPVFEIEQNGNYVQWLDSGYEHVLWPYTTTDHDRRMVGRILEITEIQSSWYVLRSYLSDEAIARLPPPNRMRSYVECMKRHEDKFVHAFARRENAFQAARENHILPRVIDGYTFR